MLLFISNFGWAQPCCIFGGLTFDLGVDAIIVIQNKVVLVIQSTENVT